MGMQGTSMNHSRTLPAQVGEQPPAALRVRGLTVRFGGLTAVRDLDLDVQGQGVHALIGPNGAGKSTAVNAISGFVRASGEVAIAGRSARSWSAHAAARAGLARTFQNIRLFGLMTVLETVLVGSHARFGGRLLPALLRTPEARRREQEAVAEARRLIRFVGLPEGAQDQVAGALPYGHQRRVEIARALISRPAVLLLDEPMAGMNVSEKAELEVLIREVCRSGVAILLIEHDMDVVRRLASQVTVLCNGQKLAEGTADEVLALPEVRAAYLGKGKS